MGRVAGEIVGDTLIALVGPAGAGKTSLAEALLHTAGAISRRGKVEDGNTIGDASPEARSRGGSTESNFLHFDYHDQHFAIVDAPGSPSFSEDAARAVAVADLAIVVVDPDPGRAVLAAPALRMLDEQGIPHLIFVNRIDQAHGSIRDLLKALQPLTVSPLIARQLPIRENDKITGFVDLALERAYSYRIGKASEQIEMPEDISEDEVEARNHMLEQLADHDDRLLEQLLMDETPEDRRIFEDLHHETEDNLGVSVLFGSATGEWGIRRLLKALRHDGPGPDVTARRLGVEKRAIYAAKTHHGNAVGRLTIARALGGSFEEGEEISTAGGARVRLGSILSLQGGGQEKADGARNGQLVGVAKVDDWKSGEWAGDAPLPPPIEIVKPARNARMAIAPRDRKDDVRLSSALAKIIEEDAGLGVTQEEGQLILIGMSDEHLNTALQRLEQRYGVAVNGQQPNIPYRESIRKPVTQRGRHKKQSGGHGQFGDVVIEVRPLARGEGFRFDEQVKGGNVPKQYIPAVEAGVKDAMTKGPLGFPVVDVAVTLLDGSYHSVDSSELAFRTAGRVAMQEALEAAKPHLLEPMHRLTITAPNASSSRIGSSLASRRGQMLGMMPRDGWEDWDRIDMLLPASELDGLDAELRSLSQGLASYEAEFDHLADVNGALADRIVAREREPAD
ncbi:elongation factor G [Sphingomicrobium lutaoense]|uniref:Elongation factor G n=1 Tax=Sphingomicrobium lutaoense TaxID=515949 RepID=A0A839YYT8_9SPHN|nr:elongation factor G [Sphingomicrobium lutaoense]MBB3763640.1 elongation factor G [Sphingomicrobium lutaoense]